MKVIEDTKDRYGINTIVLFSRNLDQIYEYLMHTYPGYKFATVIDTSKDEWEETKTTNVYFLDDLQTEIEDYTGKKLI